VPIGCLQAMGPYLRLLYDPRPQLTSFFYMPLGRLSSRMQVKAGGASQCFVYFSGR